MPTLELSLGRYGRYNLASVPDFTVGALHQYVALTFCSAKRIHYGNSYVYQGELQRGPDKPIDVVCKMTFNEDSDRLEDEAGFYSTQLKPLQDSAVPKFYGLFTGTYINSSGRNRAVRCILLEPWGSPLQDIEACPMKLRIAIVEAVLRIHAAGVQHNDLCESNILISADGREARLVDFDHATKHRCMRRMRITLYSYPPLEADVQCEEVYEIASIMDIWPPRYVWIHGIKYSIHGCPTPTKFLELRGANTQGYTREQLLEEAEAVIGEYVREYGDRFRFIGEPGNPTDIAEPTDSELESDSESESVSEAKSDSHKIGYRASDTKVHLLGRLQ
ncbi:uncharacterized protein PHACADRAFT_181850 [Phanerochaete carnosa HHB-10118-sp]|uniref:Uncharacterized protein n=1 Tax=Phanerochaete carnosa (strain HHB-10118-sp) TaxID=650164 RepID=K5WL72_PHACS|nr:uncharacterized protein PHACADRAFT_181850 [Phanerochaete carnosa HHB-10118-sp]EKM59914.1 hypothetical protein PHACADRAFT_181850 [Phanerochaete carnosa HHB-10118-sp]